MESEIIHRETIATEAGKIALSVFSGDNRVCLSIYGGNALSIMLHLSEAEADALMDLLERRPCDPDKPLPDAFKLFPEIA